MRRAGALAAALACAGCAAGYAGEKGPSLTPFAPADSLAATARPRRFALAIGVDAFEDERFKPLRYAVGDARAVGEALAAYDDVQVLVDPAQTSRAAVLEALRALAARARDPRDTVVVYVSSHGSLGRRPGGPLGRYLVTRDTRLDLLAETGLGVEDLLRQVDRIPSRRKAVVLAMCHSGKGKSQLSDDLERALAQHKAALPSLEDVSEATVVLTASAFGETARESEALGHDIYTHFWLEALRLGDRDGDGAVTASEAHDWAREKTYAYTHGAQRPTSESDILGKDPIVLSGAVARVGKPVLYSYATSAEGLRVLVNGTAKGVLPGGIAVEPGRSTVELQSAGETIYRGTLSLAAGEHAELSRLIPRRWELGVQAEGGGLLALSSDVRSRYLPAAWETGARVYLRNWPVEGLLVHARFGALGSKGTDRAFDTDLPFTVSGTRLEFGAGYTFYLGEGVSVAPSLVVGQLFLDRAVTIEGFRSTQSLRGTTGALEVDAEVTLWRWIRLGLRAELGVAKAQLGVSDGPHGFAAASLQVGVAL